VHLNGLETSLVLAAIIWTVIGATERWSPVPFGAFLGVLPFLRPELAVLGALCFVLWAVGQQAWRDRVVGCAVAAGVSLTLLGAQIYLSGSALPATGAAKTIFFSGAPGMAQAWFDALVQQSAGFFLVVSGVLSLAIVVPRPARPISVLATLFALLVVVILLLDFPSFMGQNHYRYLYIFFPIALINAAVWVGASERARLLVALLLVGALAQSVWTLGRDWTSRAEEVVGKYQELSAKAAWVHARTAPEAVVMVHDIGYMSYATDRSLFDVVGLRSSRAVAVNASVSDLPWLERRGQAFDRFARETGACYFIVTEGCNRWLGLTRAFEAQGWRLIAHPGGHPPGHEAYLIDRPGCAFR